MINIMALAVPSTNFDITGISFCSLINDVKLYARRSALGFLGYIVVMEAQRHKCLNCCEPATLNRTDFKSPFKLRAISLRFH